MQKDFKRFILPNNLQKDLLCYSDAMGFEDDPDFRIDRLSFNNYLIMHIVSGKLWCHQNNQKIAVLPGESILLDLHDPHEYYFEKDVYTRIAWLHINGSPATQIIEYMKPLYSFPVKTDNSEFFSKILAFFEFSDQPDPNIFKQSELCYSLLLEMLSLLEQETQNSISTPRLNEFKEQIWYCISHNLHRELTLDEMARFVSLSKYHFIRTFKEAFGMPPIQFVTSEKIHQAKYRLTHTTSTISEISESLGFSSPGYFTKVFKQFSGFSPSDYRKHGDL